MPKYLYQIDHYNCNTKVLHPPKDLIPYNIGSGFKNTIPVDECLADEIENLWENGIRTCGCCCGHGVWLGFIEVIEKDIPKMEQMGYQHYIYEKECGGKERLDAFIPKSYGHIYDSFYKYNQDDEEHDGVGGDIKLN